MLITGTSDKIQFVLGASVTSTQLSFTVDYNNYTSTSVTLVSNNGTSNNTTAVNLVNSPNSGEQNELRYCSIYNSDTSSATVKIQVFDGTNTRIVFQCTLAAGDTLQYQLEKGWEVVNYLGNKKTFGIQTFGQYGAVNRAGAYRGDTTSGTLTLATTSWYAYYMGRAEKSYSTINFVYNVTTLATGITYAELAVYTVGVMHSEALGGKLDKRVGFTNLATIINSTGIKNTAVSVSGINPGERMYVVIAGQWTTAPAIRAVSYADGTATYHTAILPITGSGARPSLQSSSVAFGGGTNGAWISWQGT
jgi:hypothetical protein